MLRPFLGFVIGLGLTTHVFAESTGCLDDLSANIQGTTLYLKGCQMQPDDVQAVADFLRSHPSVTGLALPDNNNEAPYPKAILNPSNVQALIAVPTLLSLDISWSMSLKPEVVEAIAKSQTLKSLDLSETMANADEMNALAKNTSLEKLNLSEVYIKPMDDLALIGKSVTLKRLKMFSRYTSDPIIQAVANIPTLEQFFFGDEYAKTKISENILLKLVSNRHLTALAIVYQNMTIPMLQALAQNPNLSYLVLAGDHINNEGAAYFKNMPALLRLTLDNNDISDAGLDVISENSVLQVLSVESNHFTEAGIINFAQKTHVRQLDLSHNTGVNGKSLMAIFDIPELKTIDLEMTGLTDDEAILIAHQQKLSCINLNYNHIGSDGAMAFAQYGKADNLSLLGNELSSNDYDAIQQNPAIKKVWTDWMDGLYDFRSCVYYVR